MVRGGGEEGLLTLRRGGKLNRGFMVSESQVLNRSQYFFQEHVLMCVTSTCI